jgi:uncharacterized protein (TIGR02246 family)
MAGRLTAEDRLEILDLLGRYAHAQDDGDPERFLSCFIPDAELDIGYRLVSGAAELREFADYFAKKPGRPGWQHHITTVSMDGDDEHCSVRSYLVWLTRNAEGASQISGHADYFDECVKVDGRWLLARHVVKV